MDGLKKEYCERLLTRITSDIKKYWSITNEKPSAVVIGENEYDMLEDYHKRSPYYNPNIKLGVYTIMGAEILRATNCDMNKLYYIAF